MEWLRLHKDKVPQGFRLASHVAICLGVWREAGRPVLVYGPVPFADGYLIGGSFLPDDVEEIKAIGAGSLSRGATALVEWAHGREE